MHPYHTDLIRLLLFFMLLMATPAHADLANDQAAVAGLVPGAIINRPWGWVISTPGGSTHVMKSTDGYTITTPKETFYLVRTSDGFRITPGQKGVRVLSPDEAYDVLVKRKKRR